MWYKLYIRHWDNRLSVRYVLVKNKWDLFAVIGWIYSTAIEKIERIDYERSEDPDNNLVLRFPRDCYENGFKEKRVDFIRREAKMIGFEDMELCIQEWFADHAHEGLYGIAKVYATIMKEAERQLEYFGTRFREGKDGD